MISKGMVLLGSIFVPGFVPVVEVEPTLRPVDDGTARTMLASMSFAGFFDDLELNRKSDAASVTGTAMTGVICSTTTEAVERGGKPLSESVTRYRIRHGIEVFCCASRMAAASESVLFCSHTGSITVFQKSVELFVDGCKK